MNILFMSLSNYDSILVRGLYSDLLRQFIKHGDAVYLISPFERGSNEKEHIIIEDGATIIKVKIWKMQKTNLAEKSLSMITIDRIFIRAIKQYFFDVKFDLVLYPTPPITLLKSVSFVKKRDGAASYLLLKDIFPQNAIDIGVLNTKGLRKLIYKYFRRKEKSLYRISDYIGCMSEANVEYILAHNPELVSDKVEVCPNTIDPVTFDTAENIRKLMRKKFDIPLNKTVFVYGGNLGSPQDIPFVIDCLRACESIKDVFFLIVGKGTELWRLERFIQCLKPKNVKLINYLPKEEYDSMIVACDVGLVFLNHRFTIPNFPSRMLSYMNAKIPVIACTDVYSDVGKVIVNGGFGWWCESDDKKKFRAIINKVVKEDLRLKGENGYMYLRKEFSSEVAYKVISKHFEKGLSK